MNIKIVLGTLFVLFGFIQCNLILERRNDSHMIFTCWSPRLVFSASPRVFKEINNATISIYDSLNNNTSIYQNTIVLYNYSSQSVAERFFTAVYNAQQNGAIAVVVGSSYQQIYLGRLMYYNVGISPLEPLLKIPIYQISNVNFKILHGVVVNNTENFMITMDTINLISHYESILTSFWMYAFQVIIGLTSAIVFAIGAIKYVAFWKHQGFVRNIPQTCLILEMCGLILRFVYFGADPLGMHHVYTNAGTLIMLTISTPFTLSSTLLLTFYWHETMSNSGLGLFENVEKFKIPCYLLIFLIYLLEFLKELAYAFGWTFQGFTYANGASYIAVSGAITIFYTVTAIRIFLALSEKVKVRSRDQRLNKVTIKLFVCGICHAVILCVSILSITPVYNQIYAVAPIWFALNVVLNLKALLTVAAFQVKSVTDTTKRSTFNSKSEKDGSKLSTTRSDSKSMEEQQL